MSIFRLGFEKINQGQGTEKSRIFFLCVSMSMYKCCNYFENNTIIQSYDSCHESKWKTLTNRTKLRHRRNCNFQLVVAGVTIITKNAIGIGDSERKIHKLVKNCCSTLKKKTVTLHCCHTFSKQKRSEFFFSNSNTVKVPISIWLGHFHQSTASDICYFDVFIRN